MSPTSPGPPRVADLLAGPIFYRHLVCRGGLDVDYADRVVDAVLAGVTPRVASAPTVTLTV